MPSYKYRVLLDNGKLARGKILAYNKSHAIQSLKNENVQPISIKRMKDNKKYRRPDYSRVKREFIVKTANGSKKKVDLKNLKFQDIKSIDFHPFSRVTSKDIIIFVNNFYILKKSNFNNVQALEALIESTEKPVFKEIIEDILIEVQAGERIYRAMENYPKVFPVVFRNFIRVGEESGNLETALLYAKDYVESSMKLKKKVRSAVIPRILQFIGIMGVMMAAVFFGVPLLQNIYDMFDSSQTVSEATMAMLNFTTWFVSNWPILLFVVVIAVVIFVMYYITPRGKYNVDKVLILSPVVGELLNNVIINKFFNAMLLNLRNGMRIQEALEISKNVTNNYYFLSAIETGKANAIAGKSWLEPFEEMKLFNPMIIQMVGIGMQTDLSEMIDKVNYYIESEVNESLAKFIKALPEITYIFVGAALILFTITVLKPLIEVYMGGFIDIPT